MLTELGYKIFLDRYALKETDRTKIEIGDTVLLQVDNQKEIGEVLNITRHSDAEFDAECVIKLSNKEELTVSIEAVDKPIELEPKQMWNRVALEMASQEKTEQLFETWLDNFNWLLDDWRFIPGGRILAGAGTNSELTYFNCYVIPNPKDSKEGIFNTLNQMAQLMARGGGVGINISSLRPRYAYTKSTHGRSSGAVSWGEIYSYTIGLIENGGSRRGAGMLILEDWHPDIYEFVTVKRDAKRITNANISVGISDAFMKAVEEDGDWELIFPDTSNKDYDEVWDGDIEKWKAEEYPVKIYKTVKARELWDLIIESAWMCAEPGLWFKNTANKQSNSWYYAPLICTNPCGEICLPAWGNCLLGAINLSKFVDIDGHVAWDMLASAVHYAVRFLDNAVDASPYFYQQNKERQLGERRLGLGTMGLAEMLIILKLRYGSPESINFVNELYEFIMLAAYDESVNLAEEKGEFSQYTNQLLESGFAKRLPKTLRKRIQEHGLRNVTLLTQAPTGTTGTLVNTSTGIEPFYFWEYERKGRLGSHTECVKVYEDYKNNTKCDDLPKWMVTAQDLSPEDHIKMQAAIQNWVDSSISKTCNIPESYTKEQVGELYQLMYKLGCKGGTVYRDKSRNEQVLNLKETKKSVEWRKRPKQLDGKTYRKETPVGTAYITVNQNGDKEPFEVFINVGKVGSDVAADAESLGRLISLILRMPSNLSVQERVATVAAQLSGIGSGRAYGFGSGRVMSLADSVAKAMLEHVGATTDILPSLPEYDSAQIGDICPDCGNASFINIEGCKKCFSCGHSEC